jgi:hypothetical protein
MTPPQVEGVAWRKSTYSGGSSGGECVEIAIVEQTGMIRDSKNADGGKLAFRKAALQLFIRSATAGELS